MIAVLVEGKVGWIRRLPDGRVRVRLIDVTQPGRDARALLEEGIVHVLVEGGLVRLGQPTEHP